MSFLDQLRTLMRFHHLDVYVVPGKYILPFLNGNIYRNHQYQNKIITTFEESVGRMLSTKHICYCSISHTKYKEVAIITLSTEILFSECVEKVDDDWIAMKQGLSTWKEYLVKNVDKNSRIGISPILIPAEDIECIVKKMKATMVPFKENLIEIIWNKLKITPNKDVQPIQDRISTPEKLIELRFHLFEKGAYGMILTDTNELSWLFNLQLPDIKCYAMLTKKETTFYIDHHYLFDHLTFVQIRPFSEFYNDIATLSTQLQTDFKIIISGNTDVGMKMALGENHILEEEYSYVSNRKALLNKNERTSLKSCYMRDGVAIVTFLAWLERKLINDDNINISEAERRLDQCRRLQEKYEMVSNSLKKPRLLSIPFDATQNSTSPSINPDSILYINSNGKYNDGTANFTGTFHFKNPSPFEKQCFTRVLQAHIAIDNCVFPRGTTGDLVDSFGRQMLWRDGLDSTNFFIKNNYNENFNHIPLASGMALSNEPTYIGDATFCVKNTVLVKQVDTPLCKNSFSLGLEHISFVPLCRKLIQVELLSPQERNWVNSYHKECFDHLSQKVDESTLAWLMKETLPI